MNIVFIGAGNLATHLAIELFNQSYPILQVYSRTYQAAETLANKVNSVATNDISQIVADADIYFFSVKDSALEDILQQMPSTIKGLYIHTAGSIPMNIFSPYNNRYGVLYPFQTFSKEQEINFNQIPIFFESNNIEDDVLIQQLGLALSSKVYPLPSEQRKYLHLTGVFTCNFVNHMYTISKEILEKENIPFDILLPLIEETTRKIHRISPQEAQTGPAIRYDKNVIDKHLELITDPLIKEIYQSISKHIYQTYQKK